MKYDWDDLKIFCALAEEGSVAKASKLLQVNQSTVLRRISTLEEALNITLFIRDKGEYNLTEEGQVVLTTARSMSDYAAALEKKIAIHNNNRVSGEVLLSAADFVVSKLLAPNLEKLLSDFPELNLRIRHTNAFLDIAKGEADIVIRITYKDRPEIPANFYGRRLTDISLCAYMGKDRNFDDVSWLLWEDVNFREWVAGFKVPERPIRMVSNSPLINLELIKKANFAAILPCFLGDADKDIRRIEGCPEFVPLEAWVLTHEDMRHTKRVTTIMKYLASCFNNISG